MSKRRNRTIINTLILYNLTLAITTKILVRFLLKINELIKIQMTFLASGNSGVFCHSNPAYNNYKFWIIYIYMCICTRCVCVQTYPNRHTQFIHTYGSYVLYSHCKCWISEYGTIPGKFRVRFLQASGHIFISWPMWIS